MQLVAAKFSECNLFQHLLGQKGDVVRNSYFLMFILTLWKAGVITQIVPKIFLKVCLSIFFEKMCEKAILWHFSSWTLSASSIPD